MKRHLVALVLPALLLTGCEIFIMDYGEEGMPCLEDNDCTKGLRCISQRCSEPTPICGDDAACIEPMDNQDARCSWENQCYIPQQDGFGDICDPDGQNNCPESFGICYCFQGDTECHCTIDCHNFADCGGGPTSRRCTQADPNYIEKYCAEPGWTGLLGGLCENSEFHCQPEGECVAVLKPESYQFCTRPCTPGDNACPLGMECAIPFSRSEYFCVFPSWIGFGQDCPSGDMGCGEEYEYYPYCHEISPGWSICTRECQNGDECPPSTHCDTMNAPPVCIPNW